MTQDEVVFQIKKLMAERLRLSAERLQTLELHTPLLKDGFGLDSLDCVELLTGMEDEFGLVFEDADANWAQHFSSLEALTHLVLHTKGESA